MNKFCRYSVIKHIESHSIQKGAISYLSGALGGLQTAAVCVHAGWTMGKVKDIYMRYVDNGDKFVGRCLALLPLLSSKFACSPPHFLATDNDHAYWDAIHRAQVPMVSNIPEYSMLTCMCLVSLLFHRKWIANTFPVNHIAHCSSVTLRRADIVAKFESNPNIVVVAYPWNDTSNHTYSGIPLHTSMMQQLTLLQTNQTNLIDSFVSRVKVALGEFGIDSERLTIENLNRILDQFRNDISNELQGFRGGGNQGGAGDPGVADPEEDEPLTFRVHVYAGKMSRVPADWCFPRCGVFDLWRQWWIGDLVRQIPPLMYIDFKDVDHLDEVPVGEEEMHGRTGAKKASRRAVRKTLCDMKFLMCWVSYKVKEAGAKEEEATILSVDRMFQVVAHLFSTGTRDGQKKWITVVNMLCRKSETVPNGFRWCQHDVLTCMSSDLHVLFQHCCSAISVCHDSGWWWVLTFVFLVKFATK